MKRGLSFSLPVTAVVLAIGYIYFSTVFVFIERWFGLTSSPGIMNASVFTAVALMCVFNYAVAIFTDPGRVPSTYMPDVEDSHNSVHEIKRKDQRGTVVGQSKAIIDLEIKDIKDGGDLRYCQKCSHLKPPRAHHCRICKRCVLRMDHHCIWINNCVGHANYKVFFVFVVYAVIACIYALVLLVGSLTVEPQKDEQQSDRSFRTVYVISVLLLVPVNVALGVLLGWHIYLSLQNKTTIEYHEGVRALWLAKKGGHVYKHPYDIGAYENLTTVLGPNIFCWLCPTLGHVGSGLQFRTAYDTMTTASTS
uniref:S-acyltransferase n=2 Tax=Rhizophora mucronata TaxID=61149 RepID=A0A2P2K8J5_RHIMU